MARGMTTARGKTIVTGASTGIGEATVRRLVAEGFDVLATARREERLRELSRQTGCDCHAADLTDEADVERLVEYAVSQGAVTGLVNNAGGAIGVDSVADGDPAAWLGMYEKNVLATLRLTKGLLPHLREAGGDIVFVTSMAAFEIYPGGAGYVAAKHAERVLARTLRLELLGEPVRVVEVAPGLVKTEEFSLNRLGDAKRAQAVYAGVEGPLVADDVADVIAWALTRPPHVNIDLVRVMPRNQSDARTLVRDSDADGALPVSSLQVDSSGEEPPGETL